MMRTLCLLVFTSLLPVVAHSQVSPSDSLMRMPLIIGQYGYHFPGGHLAERFGNHSSIGFSFLQKTKHNFLYGGDWNFVFSQQVREDDIFRNIAANNGMLINQQGAVAEIRFYHRGFYTQFKAGKLFSFLAPNPNSGFFVLGGIGLLQHKIRIENPGNVTPQINGDYKKGYDRLTNGLAASGMVGYMFFSNNRLINFYAGLEVLQAWTQSRRDWDFDKMAKDETQRIDKMTGIKAGWIIPLYKKMPQKFYFY
jgi:hypothetical protein